MSPDIERFTQGSLKDLLLSAKNGNEDALIVLLTRCEPLINKLSIRDGYFDPDLKSHLIADWLNVIQKFDPMRYYSEEKVEIDQS